MKIQKAINTGKGCRVVCNNDEAERLHNEIEGGMIRTGKIGKAFKSAKHYLGDTEKRQYGKNIMKVVNKQNQIVQSLAKGSQYIPMPDELQDGIQSIAKANNSATNYANKFHEARQKGETNQFLKGAANSVIREGVKAGILVQPQPQQYDYEGGALPLRRLMKQARNMSTCDHCGSLLHDGGSFRANGGSFRANGGSFRTNGGSIKIHRDQLYDDNNSRVRSDEPSFWPTKPLSIKRLHTYGG
jgi:hypothetical protein